MPANASEPPQGKSLTIALGVFALLAVLLGTYTAGYCWLGRRLEGTTSGPGPTRVIVRRYGHEWQVKAFWPISRIEAALRGDEVVFIIDT